MMEKIDSKALTEIEQKLATFFDNNPWSKITCDQGKYVVEEPWGDTTLAVFIPESDPEDAFDTLNSITLPREFSAIFHNESQTLEVLWTSLKLGAVGRSVAERKFEIFWKNKYRVCEFKESSSELKIFSKICRPIRAENDTNHRNIFSFNLYNETGAVDFLDVPRSFFLDCSDLAEDERLEFVRHLNAYMLYFDRKSPRILIHAVTPTKFEPMPRSPNGDFPDKIVTRKIDDNLIALWTEAFSEEDTFMKFLLLYRVVEFSGLGYFDGETLKAFRRVLSDPALPSKVDQSARALAGIFNSSKDIDQIARMQAMIEAKVDLQKLWCVVEPNKEVFCDDFVFDGGFTLKRLISGKCEFENWKPNAVRNTFDRLRGLRNALSHGADNNSRGTIKPSRENAQNLLPWLNLLETISAEVIFLDNVD
ncbi:hypothetical protein [Pacificibacter marinus]|uniref:hypothetical protein n=1 Tax=Pacificibacter marinus TaxID=658057 RepID=UPI001C075EFB|nr:hypothetical protein [Pacificibacter marinus]MBU2868311.1 hypothetical protein [Pacificibacter marinus]